MPDGQIATRPINNIATNLKQITCSGRFRKKIVDSNGNKPFLDNTRQNNPVYTNTFQNENPNVGSFWVIETAGTDDAIQSQLYKVVSVEETDDFQYTITGVLHNESKYAVVEENEVLEHRDITNLDLIPSAPQSFAVDNTDTSNVVNYPIEQLYKDKNQVKVRLLVAWKPVLGVNRYELKYRKDNGGFITVELQDPFYTIDDINVSQSAGSSLFDLRVRSISGSGKKSSGVLSLDGVEVFGKNTVPSQVKSDFAASLDPNLGVVLSWTANTPTHPNFSDLDVRGYIIYEGTYGVGTLLGEYNATSVIVPTLPASNTSSQLYSIKAIDDDGNVSNTPRTTTINFLTPNAPATLTGQYQDDNYILSWSASVINGNRFAIKEYEVYQANLLIATVTSLSFTLPVTWSSAQTFKVKARDIIGKESTFITLNVPFDKAAAPNIEYFYEGTKLRLSWAKPTEGNTKIKDYVIKASATNNTDFGNAVDVDVINSESYLLDVNDTNLNTSTSRRFFVAARDANGTIGEIGRTGISNYPDVSLSAPPAPANLTAVIKGISAFVSWDEVPIATDNNGKVNGLPIAFYKIYRENAGTLESAITTPDFQQNGTSITEEVTWSDATQKYFVRAIDVNGNNGLLNSVDFTVAAPSAVTNLRDEVIDNNVLLRWTESSIATNQLPIKHYNIYRDTTSASNLVGQKLGTFTTVFEQVSGSREYILKPVNTAGTEGTQASVVATVNEPPDFVLQQDFTSSFNGTIVNGFADGGGLFFAINSTRTWKQHFDPNNNDTSRTFGVYGGSTVYALPSENTGSYEEIIDTGADIASTRIEASIGVVASETIGSGLTLQPQISTAPNNNGSPGAFTLKGTGSQPDGTLRVLGTNFRFIKIKYNFIGAGNDDLIKVNSIRVKTFLKQITDQGRVTVTQTESQGNGKNVSFTKTFVDIDSIQLTIKGVPTSTSAKYAIYDFQDSANPQNGFKVFLFDSSGNGVAGTVDFTVRGV